MSDRSDCDDIDDDVTLPRPSDESSAAAAAAAAGETFALPKLPEELNNPPFTPSEARPWDVQVMVYNVAKRQNIGNMVRSAVAFGASAIIVVGNRHINTFGNKNTNNYIRFAHYDKLDDAVAALRARDYDIGTLDNTPARAHSAPNLYHCLSNGSKVGSLLHSLRVCGDSMCYYA